MMDLVNGQIRVRAWPRKRGHSGTPEQRANREKFAEVQRASRYIDPHTYSQIIEATQKTPLLPRDIITMMMYNRVAAFTLPDGRTLWPMPIQRDVSDALDAITQTEGMTLVRGADGWEARPYGGGGGPAMSAAQIYLPNTITPGATGWWYPNFAGVAFDPSGWATANPGYITPQEPGRYLVLLQQNSGNDPFYLGAYQKNADTPIGMTSADWDRQAYVQGAALVPMNGTTDKLRPAFSIGWRDAVAGGIGASGFTVIGPVTPL